MVGSWKLVVQSSEGVWKRSVDTALSSQSSFGRVCPAAARPIRSVGATPYTRCLIIDNEVLGSERTFAMLAMSLR